MTVKLGAYVKDSVTEFAGVVTARCEYLHGSPRIEVTATPLSEGSVRAEWFSEDRIEEQPSPR